MPNRLPAVRTLRPSFAPLPVFEPLESRRHQSVSQDADGFTVITPPAGDKVVYVSSSQGKDSNDGLSAGAPVKTLAKAATLVRNKTGDQMLLRAGDTWHETFGTWTKSGRSEDDPMVIGAYGSGPRPTIASGSATAFTTGRASFPRVDHLAITGVRFYADARDPSGPNFKTTAGGNGLNFTAASEDLLIEDCVVQGYATNIAFWKYFGPINNVRIRRSQVIDAYAKGANAEGLFAYDADGLLLEDNVFDHNGWNPKAGAVATMYNHNVYIKENCERFTARGNLFSNAASHGLQARSGGIIENNVFLNDPIGLSFGLVNGSPVTAGGVRGAIRNNVFLGGATINGVGRGMGIEVGNTAPGGGTVISGNVFAHNPAGPGFAINLEYGNGISNPGEAVGINDLTIDHNLVYDWAKGLNFMPGLVPGGKGNTGLNNVTVSNNAFQRIATATVLYPGSQFSAAEQVFRGNVYDTTVANVYVSMMTGPAMPWATWGATRETGSRATELAYADATRTAGSFAAWAGLGTGDAGFVSAARANSERAWNWNATASALADHVRAGFGMN